MRTCTLSRVIHICSGISIAVSFNVYLYAIRSKNGITKLIPVNELSRGVVRMKAGDLFITVKPGSYRLPEEILKLYS